LIQRDWPQLSRDPVRRARGETCSDEHQFRVVTIMDTATLSATIAEDPIA